MNPVTKRLVMLECFLVVAALAFYSAQKLQRSHAADRVRLIRERLEKLPEEIGDWRTVRPESVEAQLRHDVADSLQLLVRIYRNTQTGARSFVQASYWYAPAYCYELHGWAVLKDKMLRGNELPGRPKLPGNVRELVVSRKDETSNVLFYEIGSGGTAERLSSPSGARPRGPGGAMSALWHKLAERVAWKQNVIVKVASMSEITSDEERASFMSLAGEIFDRASRMLQAP